MTEVMEQFATPVSEYEDDDVVVDDDLGFDDPDVEDDDSYGEDEDDDEDAA